MAQFKLPTRKSPGDAIKADDYNLIIDALERVSINPGQSTGIDIEQSPGGTTLRVRWKTDRYLALVQSGGISARSGTTPGSGNANLQTYDPVNGISDLGITVSVLNLSASGSGIASGKYIWIQEDVNGFLWVITSEC